MLVNIKSSLSCILSHRTKNRTWPLLHRRYSLEAPPPACQVYFKPFLYVSFRKRKKLLKFQLEGLENYISIVTEFVGEVPSGGDSLMLTLAFKTRKVQKKKVCEKFRSMIKRSPEKNETSQKVKRY